MNNEVEIIDALRYKLHMFGVPIDGSTNIFCDNGAVCVNTMWPKSTLYNKHKSITYHHVQEAVVARTLRVSREHTSTTLADLYTKTMAAPKREGIAEKLNIERRIGVCGFSSLVRVYHKQLT